jgi:hypothetical protein
MLSVPASTSAIMANAAATDLYLNKIPLMELWSTTKT